MPLKDMLKNLDIAPVLKDLLILVASAVVATLVALLILRVSRKLFQKLKNTKTGMRTQFAEKMFRLIVIFVAILWTVAVHELRADRRNRRLRGPVRAGRPDLWHSAFDHQAF